MSTSKLKGQTETNTSAFRNDLIKTNGLLQSLVLEMRYHCEVYKLSLRSINKILKHLRLEHVGGDPLEISNNSIRHSARSNYQKSIVLLSQKRALEKINVVLRKAKAFINGYALLEATPSNGSPMQQKQPLSQIVTQDPPQQLIAINPPILQMRNTSTQHSTKVQEKVQVEEKAESLKEEKLRQIEKYPEPPPLSDNTFNKEILEMTISTKKYKCSSNSSSISEGQIRESESRSRRKKSSSSSSRRSSSSRLIRQRTTKVDRRDQYKQTKSVRSKFTDKDREESSSRKRRENVKAESGRVNYSRRYGGAGNMIQQYRKRRDYMSHSRFTQKDSRTVNQVGERITVEDVDGENDNDYKDSSSKSQGQEENMKIDTIVNPRSKLHSNQHPVVRKYNRYYNNNHNNYNRRQNDSQRRQYHHHHQRPYHRQQNESFEQRERQNYSCVNNALQSKHFRNDGGSRGNECSDALFDDNDEYEGKVRRIDVYPEGNNNKDSEKLNLGLEHYCHREPGLNSPIGLLQSAESQVNNLPAPPVQVDIVTNNENNLCEVYQVQEPRVTTIMIPLQPESNYLEDPRLKKRQILEEKVALAQSRAIAAAAAIKAQDQKDENEIYTN